MHRFEATAVATLIALYATGCGHLKIYEISASTGSAPDLVFVERSSTNYVVVSNYLTTTNYWVPAQYFSPSGQKPVTNASGSNVNANISTLVSSNPVTTNSTASVARQRLEVSNSPNEAKHDLWWWTSLALLGLAIVLALILGARARRHGLVFLPTIRRARRIADEDTPSLVSGATRDLPSPEISQAPSALQTTIAGSESEQSLWPAAQTEAWLKRRILQAEKRVRRFNVLLRAKLIPHVARLLVDRFILRLISQRERLLHVQRQTSREMVYLDERLASVQKRLQEHVALYEKRIAELRKQLAEKQASEKRGTPAGSRT